MISRRTTVFPKKMMFSQTALQWFDVLPGLRLALPGLWLALPGLSLALPGAPRLVVGAPRLVAGAPRCSQVHLKATASVQLTLGFAHPGILVRQLSDTPRGSQWPKYILLMWELSALGNFWQCLMELALLDQVVVQEMCKWGSGVSETEMARQQTNGIRYGS